MPILTLFWLYRKYLLWHCCLLISQVYSQTVKSDWLAVGFTRWIQSVKEWNVTKLIKWSPQRRRDEKLTQAFKTRPPCSPQITLSESLRRVKWLFVSHNSLFHNSTHHEIIKQVLERCQKYPSKRRELQREDAAKMIISWMSLPAAVWEEDLRFSSNC